jgi:hypothetical protein
MQTLSRLSQGLREAACWLQRFLARQQVAVQTVTSVAAAISYLALHPV